MQTGNHRSTGVTLKLPLQVCRPSQELEAGLEGEEHVGVEEFFTPRTVGPPPEFDARREEVRSRLIDGGSRVSTYSSSSGGSTLILATTAATVLPPPGYSDFGRVSRVPVRIPTPPGISPGCG